MKDTQNLTEVQILFEKILRLRKNQDHEHKEMIFHQRLHY